MNKLLLIASVAAMSVLARTAGADSGLLDIYQQALANDPAWASARSAHLAIQEKLPQGRALTLPTATFGASANHSETDLQYHGGTSPLVGGAGGRQGFETYNYNVSVSHPLYRKQNNIQYEEAKTQVAQAEEQLGTARQDLMLRTAQAYFDVLLAQDRVDLLGAQKIAISRQLEQAKANFEVGTATITDVHEAQARYDLTVAQEIAAQNDMEISKRAIQAITGKLPDKLAKTRGKLTVAIPQPQQMENWVEIAERQNLQLKLRQYNLTLAGQEIELAHAGHLPTVDVVGSYNDTYANGGIVGLGSDSQNFTLGVQVQVPLYQGGAIVSKEREAVANKQKALDDLDQARRQADLQTRQAYLNVASSVAQVSALEQALVSSQSQLDSTNLGYEVGVRTSVDVLNAQQQYYSAKRDLLQARYTYLLSTLKLKAAAGMLADGDMVEVNSQLGSDS
jgi:outer membrane protein